MSKCLVAMGSNLGDRAATLDAAAAELRAAAGVSEVRASAWQMTLPVGGAKLRREFLNGVAIVETSRDPVAMLQLLGEIEASHGRERHERWSDRTLDLDLLLYDDLVIDTPELIVPHPRMSFRRFVLEPAVEVAAEWMHPTVGCTIPHLLDQLEVGVDCVAIVSHDSPVRGSISESLMARFGVRSCEPICDDSHRWPRRHTSWVSMTDGACGIGEARVLKPARLESSHPKLTVMIHEGFRDADPLAMGRGPTLRVPAADGQDLEADVFAAVEAVWPRLGSVGPKH